MVASPERPAPESEVLYPPRYIRWTLGRALPGRVRTVPGQAVPPFRHLARAGSDV